MFFSRFFSSTRIRFNNNKRTPPKTERRQGGRREQCSALIRFDWLIKLGGRRRRRDLARTRAGVARPPRRLDNQMRNGGA